MPTRTCLNIRGPGEMNRLAIRIIGAVTTTTIRAARAMTISNAHLVREREYAAGEVMNGAADVCALYSEAILVNVGRPGLSDKQRVDMAT